MAFFRVPFGLGSESRLLELGIGYGVLSYLVYSLGIMGLLHPAVWWVLLPFVIFFSLRKRPRPFIEIHPSHWRWGEKTVLALLGLLIIGIFILSLSPPTGRDVLTQHLALPKLYLLRHQIFDVPFAESSYNPMQVDMLYTLALLLGSEEAASLLHFTFALLTGALIYLVSRKAGPRWLAFLGSLFFLSTPLVINLSTKAYVDLGLAFYSFAALYALLRREEDKAWITFSAIFAGFAAATKYNGFLVLFLLAAWVLLKSREPKGSLALKEAGKYLLIGLVVSSPWLLRNFLYTANPVYPFFWSWLGNPPPTARELYEPLTRRAILYGEGWRDFLTIPVRMFFQGEDLNPRYFDGVLNPIFLLLFPLSLVGGRESWRIRMAGFVVLYFVFSMFLVDMRARYIIPTLAPLTVLSVFGLARLRAYPKGGIWVGLSLGLLLLNVSYLQSYIRKTDLDLYLQGKESKQEYLSRILNDYDLWEYANANLPGDAKVMMYFLGDRGYYCDREYMYESYYSGRRLKEVLSRSPSAERLVEYFRGLKITHIALRKDLFYQFTETNLLSTEKEAWMEFRACYLRLLYEGKGYQLYQVQGGLNASGV